MATKISQKAIDMIVAFEVSSRSYYEKNYRKPEWPEGASGITIGIGYDLGYADEAKIRRDWTGVVSDTMLASLLKYKGLTGERAHAKLSAARSEIDITWDQAMTVFMNKDVPEWTATVTKGLPNTDLLSEDSLGALVSLAYNRGPSWNNSGDRYTEMRAIKAHMADKDFSKIPGDLRSMKRIWPNVRGLRDRREKEAVLFENGLK